MQTLYQDEVEGKYGGGASIMGFDICAGRVSGCVEGEYNGRTRIRGSRI